MGERGVRRLLPPVRASRGGEGGTGSGVEEFLGDTSKLGREEAVGGQAEVAQRVQDRVLSAVVRGVHCARAEHVARGQQRRIGRDQLPHRGHLAQQRCRHRCNLCQL